MELFFKILQESIYQGHKLNLSLTESDWYRVFCIAQEQSLVGVVFKAVENANKKGAKPPLPLLYEWIGVTEHIRQRNMLVNKRCVEIVKLFKNSGFKTCLLKGQGNALMYPDPFVRTPGDIDLWIDGEKNDVINFVKKDFPNIDSKVSSHHVDYPIFEDVDVEIHYIPTYSITQRHQLNMEKFIEDCKESQFNNFVCLPKFDEKIVVPNDLFNIIYQLSHMQRHFFISGIGLRHMVDYYYLLIHSYKKYNESEVVAILSSLGLLNFAQAVMWVLKEIFCIKEQYLYTASDPKRGKFLLDEIMKGGNFGQYDTRFFRKLRSKSATLSLIIRNMRFLYLFPEEAVSAPITGVARRFFK